MTTQLIKKNHLKAGVVASAAASGEEDIVGKAILKDGKISPRKIGLMVEAIRGKTVKDGEKILTMFSYKKSAGILHKLLKSAIANAVNNNKYKTEDVALCRIDGWTGRGMVLTRTEPRARSNSNRLKKVYSHVWLRLKGVR